jgi:hypothetical protein
MRCNTCFVTASGFSAPAGLPPQNRLLADVSTNPKAKNALLKIFYLKNSVDNDVLRKLQLEDVFTFLDKIILSNQSIIINPDDNTLSLNKIPAIDVTEAYNYKNILIEYLIDSVSEKLKKLRAGHRYEYFFNSIVKRKTEHNETNTIITLNWDTIQDFYINKAYKDLGIKKGGVDYCVYDRDCNTIDSPDDIYAPSILRKAKGWSTIKLIKLHGSMNWAISKKDNALCVQQQTGAYPEGLKIDGKLKKYFDRIFMTPTYIKDFSNMHTQTIWHNAQYDLAEAKRIVFLGCALQTADYEFRNLLLRTAVRGKKKIRVILHPAETPEAKLNQKQTKKHYTTLFPSHDIQFEEVDTADFLLDDNLIWRW